MGQNRELSRFPNAITVLDNGNVGIGTTSFSEGTQPTGTISIIPNSSVSSGPLVQFAPNGRIRPAALTERLSIDGNALFLNSTFNANIIMATGGGSVGIGTTNPLAQLHVYRNGTAVYTLLRINNDNSTANFHIGVGGNAVPNTALQNNAFVWNVGNSAILFATNDTERMRITNTGNIGIGTSSPTGRLTLQRAGAGADTDIDYLNEVGAGPRAKIRFGGSNEELSFWTNGGTLAERMRITSGGNVGIGTSNPTTRLQIGSITGGGTGTSSPTCITMDETFGTNSIGSNFKLKIFQNTGSNAYGLGVSDSLFEIVSGTGGSIGMFTNQNQLAMRLSAGGVVTTPLQPAFTASNVTGANVSGANVKLTGYSDVRTNIGNCYNGSTSRFTANTAGMYLFKAHAWLPPSTTLAALSIRVNGSQKAVHRMSHTGTQSNYCTLVPTLIWYLAVGDYVELYTSTDGGEVHLSTGESYSNFSGVFLG